MWKNPKSKDPVLDPPQKGHLGSKVAGARAKTHVCAACPAPSCIASSPPSPAICYFFFFPSFSEHGAVMRAQGAATGEVTSSGVLWGQSPMSFTAVSSVSWPQLPGC